MTYLPQRLSESLDNDELSIAIARDATEPFREETRKAKRNLVATAFIGIAVASLELKVESFSGVTLGAGAESGNIVRGLVCLAAVYFLIAYIADVVLDYIAWRLMVGQLSVLPFLALVRAVHRSYAISIAQFKNVRWSLDYHRPGSSVGPETSPISLKNVNDAISQVTAIEKIQSELLSEVSPLLKKWERTLRSIKAQASVRRVIRWARMWIWDFALPVFLAALCIWQTQSGLREIFPRLLHV